MNDLGIWGNGRKRMKFTNFTILIFQQFTDDVACDNLVVASKKITLCSGATSSFNVNLINIVTYIPCRRMITLNRFPTDENFVFLEFLRMFRD